MRNERDEESHDECAGEDRADADAHHPQRVGVVGDDLELEDGEDDRPERHRYRRQCHGQHVVEGCEHDERDDPDPVPVGEEIRRIGHNGSEGNEVAGTGPVSSRAGARAGWPVRRVAGSSWQHVSMSSELAVPADQSLEHFEESLAAEQSVEHALMRSIIKGVVVATPIMMVFFIGLLAVAVNDRTEWYVWVLLGSAMGLVGGILFGVLAAVTASATKLDEVDREALH